MSVTRGGRPIEILRGNSPGDVRLTIEVFKDSRITNRINVVMEGGGGPASMWSTHCQLKFANKEIASAAVTPYIC